MALTKSYYSIDGEIIGEAAGGARTGYLPDSLGSVTATVNETGAVVNTYRYKPYGSQLNKTGAGIDPEFLWFGVWGYLGSDTNKYVRLRTYDSTLGLWTSEDPLETSGDYKYASSNPINNLDYFGGQLESINDRVGSGNLFGGLLEMPPLVEPPEPFLEPPNPFRQPPWNPLGRPGPGIRPGGPPGGLEGSVCLPPVAYIRCCIILNGAFACIELANYEVGKPSGLLTTIGEGIADSIFPDPQGEPCGTRIPQCDPVTLSRLNQLVNGACKRPGLRYTCKGIPKLQMPRDAKEINEIIERNKRCKKLRHTRDVICYKGGNPGHRQQRQDVQNRIDYCLRLMNGKIK